MSSLIGFLIKTEKSSWKIVMQVCWLEFAKKLSSQEGKKKEIYVRNVVALSCLNTQRELWFFLTLLVPDLWGHFIHWGRVLIVWRNRRPGGRISQVWSDAVKWRSSWPFLWYRGQYFHPKLKILQFQKNAKTSRVLRTPIEHSDSVLYFGPICSVWILDIFEVIVKPSF